VNWEQGRHTPYLAPCTCIQVPVGSSHRSVGRYIVDGRLRNQAAFRTHEQESRQWRSPWLSLCIALLAVRVGCLPSFTLSACLSSLAGKKVVWGAMPSCAVICTTPISPSAVHLPCCVSWLRFDSSQRLTVTASVANRVHRQTDIAHPSPTPPTPPTTTTTTTTTTAPVPAPRTTSSTPLYSATSRTLSHPLRVE